MVYSYFRDDPDGGIVRELIACALREVADEVCRDHVRTISQEAQITSRIGQALETRLRGSNFNGYTIEVVTQDIPDRGGAHHHTSGSTRNAESESSTRRTLFGGSRGISSMVADLTRFSPKPCRAWRGTSTSDCHLEATSGRRSV
jgi:hypothetical protein